MDHVELAIVLAVDGSASVTYDEFGRLATKKGPRPDYELHYAYDAMGRIIANVPSDL